MISKNEENFTIVCNAIWDDSRLTIYAKSLCTILYRHAKNFVVRGCSRKEFQAEMSISLKAKDTFYKARKLLIETGWIVSAVEVPKGKEKDNTVYTMFNWKKGMIVPLNENCKQYSMFNSRLQEFEIDTENSNILVYGERGADTTVEEYKFVIEGKKEVFNYSDGSVYKELDEEIDFSAPQPSKTEDTAQDKVEDIPEDKPVENAPVVEDVKPVEDKPAIKEVETPAEDTVEDLKTSNVENAPVKPARKPKFKVVKPSVKTSDEVAQNEYRKVNVGSIKRKD